MAEDVTSYQSPPPAKRLKTASCWGTKGLLEERGCTSVAGPRKETTPHTSALTRSQELPVLELESTSSLQTSNLMAKDSSSEHFPSLGDQMPEAQVQLCWELQTPSSDESPATSQSPIARSSNHFPSTDKHSASCLPSAACSHDQFLSDQLLHVNVSSVERTNSLPLPVSDKQSRLSPVSGQIETTKLPQCSAASRESPSIRGNPSDSATPVEGPSVSLGNQILAIEHHQCQELSRIPFSAPVTHIYNPLSYAAETHQCYVCCYGNSKKRILFLGMNPGPFGMAQNGVSGFEHTQYSVKFGSINSCLYYSYIYAYVHV